jgi:hypothetical protein
VLNLTSRRDKEGRKVLGAKGHEPGAAVRHAGYGGILRLSKFRRGILLSLVYSRYSARKFPLASSSFMNGRVKS